ncbi:MAG TPA: acyltransferase [Acidimicrobiia bacterium]|nr:acyltransferase [Acidimicrobiia bacterium]
MGSMDPLIPEQPTDPGSALADSKGQLTAVETRASRHIYVDNLKVLLIAAIIAAHGLASYAALELWSYADVREVTLWPVTEGALFSLLAPFGLFMIPLLFLVAGLLTPSSVERKGPGRYARDRLVRLGIPFAVFVGLIWPLLLYALYRPLGNAPGSYWAEFVGTTEESLDTGYFWFVGDLLIFSLVFAAVFRLRRGHPGRLGWGDIRFGHLLTLAGGVGVATFLVRLGFPFESERYVDLNLYEWPAAIALFTLGVIAARHGWLTAVPTRLQVHSRNVSLLALGAFGVFMAAGFLLGAVGDETWGGGWHWDAAAFALCESTLAVFGPIWILGVAQRRLDRGFRWASPAIGRSAYGAFVLQGLVLIGLAVVLRPLPVPADVKAVIVATGGVAGSFALAWLLIRRVPGVARIL